MSYQADKETVALIRESDVFLPSAQQCQWAVVMLLALVFMISMLLYWLIVEPQQALNQQIERIKQHYQQALRLTSKRASLESQRQHWQMMLNSNNALPLKESSASLAAAAMQERVKAIVSLHAPDSKDCGIVQQKNLPSKEKGGFIEASVNVSMKCSLEPLQAIVYDLETESPLLIINNLIVRRNLSNRKNSADLSVQFDMVGYIVNNGTQSLDQ